MSATNQSIVCIKTDSRMLIYRSILMEIRRRILLLFIKTRFSTSFRMRIRILARIKSQVPVPLVVLFSIRTIGGKGVPANLDWLSDIVCIGISHKGIMFV